MIDQDYRLVARILEQFHSMTFERKIETIQSLLAKQRKECAKLVTDADLKNKILKAYMKDEYC